MSVNTNFSNSFSSLFKPAATGGAAKSGGSEWIKISATPEELKVGRGKDGKFPPTVTVSGEQAERFVFKKYGYDPARAQDRATLNERLNTENPFDGAKSGEQYTLKLENGKYALRVEVETSLIRKIQGLAQQQTQAAKPAPTSDRTPEENTAFQNTINNAAGTKAALNQKLDHPTMSAREVGTAESLTRAATDAVDSLTGTNANGSGASLNRQAVSAIKATGRVLETVGATDAGKTLQNAGTEITRADERAETLIAQSGATVPLIAQIGKDADKLAENLLDAAETTVKGDFSDKNSTGAFAGRIIGGLNPLGDMRDIAANGKDVAENKPGSYVGLGGAILGTVIPVAGDASKAAIRANKEAITEGIEAALKQTDEAATATVKTAEQPVAEAAAKTAAEQAAQITKRYDEIAQSGHVTQRHGDAITRQQLDDRAEKGFDPITGTTDDAIKKNADGTPKTHNYSKDATKFTSKEALVKADDFVKNSREYKDALEAAEQIGDDFFVVKNSKLEDIYGTNYKDQVFGKTRVGSKNNPTGTVETDFTDGTIKAVFIKDASGKWNLETMYPEPK